MVNADSEAWFELFEEVGKTRNVKILQEINTGYNSRVHLVSVDGREYAVKKYHKRHNGSKACIAEKNRILKARKAIPNAVPNVVLASEHTENKFDREILVMERANGEPLNGTTFNQQVFEELVNILKRLHSTRTKGEQRISGLERLGICRSEIMRFLERKEVIPKERVSKHLHALERYYNRKRDIFTGTRTLIHGDLWWDNILVDNGKITIVDWLESSEQNYDYDLAQLKIGTFDEILDSKKSRYFFDRVLEAYKEEFEDEYLHDKMQYYLPLMYLEESFYMPFKHFPWEIKYEENAEEFEERFLAYFEESEKSLE